MEQRPGASWNTDAVGRKDSGTDRAGALLEEVRQRAAASGREDAAFHSRKTETGDMLLSAKSLARMLVENANTQADEILTRARTQADEIVRGAEEKADALLRDAQEKADAIAENRHEQALHCVESTMEKLRKQQRDTLDFLNAQWQSFLASLEEGETPPDLEEKVGAIARELRALEEDD